MLDIKFIREHPKKIVEGLKKKRIVFDLDHFLKLDEKRRTKIQEVEELRATQNTVSGELVTLSGSEREHRITEMKSLKARLGDAEAQLKPLEAEFKELLGKIPNLPLDDVPVGDESASVVVREVGEKREFGFQPKDSVELGESLEVINTGRAAKVSGTRFGYIKREAALLELALLQYAFNKLIDQKFISSLITEAELKIPEKPFIPIIPPVLIRPEAMRAMGYVERGVEEIYHLEKDNLYLVGTSEQSIGPMLGDETFDESTLPFRFVSFSTCFRREAGSYGKDTRGIFRVHQFDKVEMVVFSTPEDSPAEHELLLKIEEAFLQELEIPYRVLLIASGDLGDPAAKKYDLEAWFPGQNNGAGEYREVTSTSNTTDFQARRLNIKLKRSAGLTEFVHMLNGTAFAIGRMLIAILENFQQADGSVKIPEVLRPYLGGLAEIRR